MIKEEIIQHKKRDFKWLSTANILELWRDYHGYLNQHGFEEKKEALFDFLAHLDNKARTDLKMFIEKYKKNH